ncbi:MULTISPECIES: DUF599 domain-containing protein [Kordiimonas]|jgi:uncharacterized membrane protein|uniref:Uncharacterized membrane protein n=1 Tax=Kordiimonas lacus TaxID=637679 RepID=A0A1G6VLR8_9PROT|nr:MULTISPECIES: DUF599 domain-containing protein [Kordiimonas]SDD54353.1 Uncharacterized membrane protein [Kordiimonas lacus]
MPFIDLLSNADLLALSIYLLAFVLYGLVADHSPLQRYSISAAMDRQRRNWMHEARRRELRMLDSNVLQILMNGISIFASTNIFVIGGLIAGIAYNEQLSDAFSRVPFAVQISPALWSLKLALLLAVFVYAFFKFAWAIRLANYCAIMVGALASHNDAESADAEARTEAAAKLASLCAFHFNRGLRANFFGLAALGWFFSPMLFIAGTIFIVLILVRREFLSGALKAVRALK